MATFRIYNEEKTTSGSLWSIREKSGAFKLKHFQMLFPSNNKDDVPVKIKEIKWEKIHVLSVNKGYCLEINLFFIFFIFCLVYFNSLLTILWFTRFLFPVCSQHGQPQWSFSSINQVISLICAKPSKGCWFRSEIPNYKNHCTNCSLSLKCPSPSYTMAKIPYLF